MKKITILIPDDEAFEMSADMMKNVIEFHIERILENKPKAFRQKVHRSKETTILQTIMAHYLAGGSFSRERGTIWLTEKGFAKTSLSAALSILKKMGFIEEVERHKYNFLKPMD